MKSSRLYEMVLTLESKLESSTIPLSGRCLLRFPRVLPTPSLPIFCPLASAVDVGVKLGLVSGELSSFSALVVGDDPV